MRSFPLKILNYFREEAAAKLKEEIRSAGGNELFAVGSLDGEDLIKDIKIIARGHEAAVPLIESAILPGEVIIHNHPSGDLRPSDADLVAASRMGAKGYGFLIVDNGVSDLYPVLNPMLNSSHRIKLDVKRISGMLEDGGLVSRSLAGYESRPQQIEMLRAVCEAFNYGRHALIEAGTGTGKSLAYLIPSIFWALQNGEKVVISTNTINLQEQLVYKDIPFLAEALKAEFSSALVKGRPNYICRRKLKLLAAEADTMLDDEERGIFSEILSRVSEAESGCLSELGMNVPSELWERICSDRDSCKRGRCENAGSCFVNMARRAAANADILVVNHHLLFADVGVRRARGDDPEIAVLPRYKYVIFDEAHNLHDVATEYLGFKVGRIQVVRLLNRLFRKEGRSQKQKDLGLLISIREKLLKIEGEGNDSLRIAKLVDARSIPNLLRARDALDAFFDSVRRLVVESVGLDAAENALRLKEGIRSGVIWDDLIAGSERFRIVISELVDDIRRLHEETESLEHGDKTLEELNEEILTISDRLKEILDTVDFIIKSEDREYVYWIDVEAGDGRRRDYSLRATPLNVSREIYESLLSRLEASVFTSATLTVEDSFEYMKSLLGVEGVDPQRIAEYMIGSPFNYEKQVLLCIPSGFSSPDESGFIGEAGDFIGRLLKATGGRAFLLFTSYSMLKEIGNQIRAPLKERGIELLCQGEAPRHKLLSEFKRITTSVLLGTDSFWEGVDVPGESLSCVVIMKLPFKVPTDPVTEARVELIRAEGKNPFYSYVVPNAVIKLKQGFGRLIRTREDRGVVVIMDNRILKKGYGGIFMSSLPRCTKAVGPPDKLLARVEDWL